MQLLLDPWFVATGCVAVTLLGLSKGGFIGLGTMGLPLLSLFVPPMQAAAILLPTLLAQDVLTIWTYRRDWSGWNLAVLLPSMGLGISVAYFFAAAVSPTEIRLAVGIIIIVFVLRHWLGSVIERVTLRPGVGTGILFGIIGGFSTMLANAGGPAWQMHLLPQKLDKLTYVGTITMLFAASNIMKIPAYGALGQLTADNLSAGATLLPVAVAANYAGIWLVRRTPTEVFYRIAYVLMFVIALELIRNALTEMMRSA
ncbi:MAG TPA: sulfite exporter TauE/SafE family protein [Xanthobacteraceae bacterium]|nr:sulfite exporter TauE/SafE family protein [Xanthobacteraceae bacterium]